jgi:tetratricopeptide (TPR) repeat protein
MDLMTLSLLLAVLTGTIGLDTVLHPAGVVVEASIPAKYDRVAIDADTIAAILNTTVAAVSATPSVDAAPEIRVGSGGGVGMAVADALKIQPLALALQNEFGIIPERLKIAILSEDGTTKILVSGSGLGGHIRTPPFEYLITIKPGESLVDLVRRGGLVGLARIDPYFTALYLIQSHVTDRDFQAASALIDAALAQCPPTPISAYRAMFANLQGILALFQGSSTRAHDRFLAAAAADPDNAVAGMNAAFVDVLVNDYRAAVTQIRRVTMIEPRPNNILLATAYMTWGAALLGLHDVNGADQMLAKSIELYPATSAGYDLWADVKSEKGDTAAAERYHRRALENSDLFENYAEVAALWFKLSWRDDESLVRNQLNPMMLQIRK